MIALALNGLGIKAGRKPFGHVLKWQYAIADFLALSCDDQPSERCWCSLVI